MCIRDRAYHGPDHTGHLIAGRLAEPDAEEYLDQVLRLDVTTLIVDDPVKRVDNMTCLLYTSRCV